MQQFVHIHVNYMNRFTVWFMSFQIQETHDTEWLETEATDFGEDLETDPDEWKLFPYINNTTAFQCVEVIFLKTIVFEE